MADDRPMDPTGNPTTAGTAGAQRQGPQNPSQLAPYLQGALIRAAMSAPTGVNKCTYLGNHLRAEFIVRAPDGITAFTIRYGRWVQGKQINGSIPALDGWVETGSLAVTGATDGELFRVELDTLTDAVGCYVDAFTGSIAASPASFAMWVRGMPGIAK